MPVAAVLGGSAIGAIGSIFSGNEQAKAAKYAANLQYQEQQNALGFQENEFNTQQQNEEPWLQAGKGAIGNLAQLANGGLPAWDQTFQAPTAAQAEATPGYQFQLQQGQQALQNSAAARGGLLSSGTAKSLDQYSQGLASTNYQQTYNNSLTQYQQAYNEYQQNQANQFNRLASVAGIGQTAAGQLGQQGQAAASNIGNLSLLGGQQIGSDIQQGAAANASGYAGATNAIGGGIGNLGQLSLLSGILNNGGGSGGGGGYYNPTAAGDAGN